jgi:hypothetical protein
MAADRCVTTGWTEHTHEQPKLWASSDWITGGSGNMRAIQVLKHWLIYPRYRPDEDQDWEAFAVKTLVPAVRTAFSGTGVVETKNVTSETVPFTALFAVKDRIVELSPDFCAFSDLTGRSAIGSGYRQALGFLGDSGPWTEKDVVEAVRRSAQTAVGVGLPIDVVDTKTLVVRRADV